MEATIASASETAAEAHRRANAAYTRVSRQVAAETPSSDGSQVPTTPQPVLAVNGLKAGQSARALLRRKG